MAIAGDSRFGQWADPNFGATLTGGQTQPQQGVLPSPQASASASSDQSNGVVPTPSAPSNPWGNLQPGALPNPGSGNNPGSIYLAEGGSPSDAQDSGDAAQGDTDPFSFIQQALTYGRQKMGLPKSFFGSDTGDAAAPSFAEGGAVDADGDDDGDQGMIPTETSDQSESQGQGQSQPNPQAAMAYLQGAGAMDPATATAMERNVDPHGQLDPNIRKMMAIKNAGSPDKAFGLMQHYRQKFNAYSAFAKAAATGSGQKPADLRASAQAATQAYQHLPDGKAVSFMPVQGGMRVNVRDVMQKQKPAQHFAEGGVVGGDDDDVDVDYETAGAKPWAGTPGDIQAQQDAAQPEQDADRPVAKALGGKAPHEALKDFVLSIPQYVGWLSKGGQADSVMDNGVETTLADAAKQQPQQAAPQQQQPMPQQGAMNPMQTGQMVAPQPQPQQPTNGAPQRPQQQPHWPRPTPQDPAQVGATVAKQVYDDGKAYADGMHMIDQAYGNWAGQQKAKQAARLAFHQNWMNNHAKIEAEQTKGQAATERAKLAGGWHRDVAETAAAARRDVANTNQTGANTRNERSNTTRRDIANDKEAGVEGRFQRAEEGRTDRSIAMNQPSAIGDTKKMAQARQSMSRPQPQQPQAPRQANPVNNQQPSATDIAYLKANPSVAAKFDARFGAGASKRVLGQ